MALTPDVTAGTIIQSAWGNQIRDRTVQVFATVAERNALWPAPPRGAMCITVDTLALWIFDTGAGGWRPTPGTVLATSVSTALASNTSASVRVQLPGSLTAAVVFPAARVVRVDVHAGLQTDTLNRQGRVEARMDSVAVASVQQVLTGSAVGGPTQANVAGSALVLVPAGSHTFDLAVLSPQGSGSITAVAGARLIVTETGLASL
jgi:hypothetical protein